ncbi:cytochrome c [Patescibacteria group bacterium]|nr:cytochrome c [Patescibacteria group bacterium]
MKILVTLYLTLIIFAGCKSKPAEEKLSIGERNFRRYCQTCHTLPKPSMKNALEWPEIVSRYGQRAKLTEDVIKEITQYLISPN